MKVRHIKRRRAQRVQQIIEHRSAHMLSRRFTKRFDEALRAAFDAYLGKLQAAFARLNDAIVDAFSDPSLGQPEVAEA